GSSRSTTSHEREIDAEVFVDELVPHTGDLPPRHRRIPRARGVRDSLYGLADDLDIANDRVLSLAVRKERLAALCRVALDRVDCRDRMKQVGPLVLHRG